MRTTADPPVPGEGGRDRTAKPGAVRRAPDLRPLALANAGYAIGLAGAALRRGEGTAAAQYLVIVGLVVLLVLAVHRRVGFSAGVLWGLTVWGLLHMAGGLVAVPEAWRGRAEGSILYSLWLVPGLLRFDHLVHASGFGVVAAACWQVLEAMLKAAGEPAPRATVPRLLLCVAAANGFGALNEVVEFIAARAEVAGHIGDYENTGWDLVANLAGSLAVAAWIRWHPGRPASPGPVDGDVDP